VRFPKKGIGDIADNEADSIGVARDEAARQLAGPITHLFDGCQHTLARCLRDLALAVDDARHGADRNVSPVRNIAHGHWMHSAKSLYRDKKVPGQVIAVARLENANEGYSHAPTLTFSPTHDRAYITVQIDCQVAYRQIGKVVVLRAPLSVFPIQPISG